MYQNMSTLSELKHKQTNLQQQILELKSDMEIFNVKCPSYFCCHHFLRWLSFLLFFVIQECVGKEVVECLQQFPVQIRGKRAPIKPDEVQPNESDTLKLLPPPLLPHKISAESALPPLVDSISSNLEHLVPDVAAAAPVGRRVVVATDNLLDGSIQELDLLALNELSISCSSSGEPNTLLLETTTDDDPFSSLSLTVQGRIIPCIPCENISPTGQQLPPSN
jgi:hypothetical protein